MMWFAFLWLFVWTASLVAVSVDIGFNPSAVSLPFPLSSGCMAETEDETIYNFGGFHHHDEIASHHHDDTATVGDNDLSDAILRYDGSSSTFDILDNITVPEPVMCYQNTIYSFTTQLIYIFGAQHNPNNVTEPAHYIFNPRTLSFQQDATIASLPFASLPCASIIETAALSVIYIYGGSYSLNNSHITTLSTLSILNLTSNTFINDIPHAPMEGYASSCFAIDHYFYVFGGIRTPNTVSITAVSDIMKYDIEGNTWQIVGNLLSARYGSRAMFYPLQDASNDDMVLIIGGYHNVSVMFSSDMEVFHYRSDQMEESVVALGENNKGFVMTSYLNNSVVVLGGDLDVDTFSAASCVSDAFDGSLEPIRDVESIQVWHPMDTTEAATTTELFSTTGEEITSSVLWSTSRLLRTSNVETTSEMSTNALTTVESSDLLMSSTAVVVEASGSNESLETLAPVVVDPTDYRNHDSSGEEKEEKAFIETTTGVSVLVGVVLLSIGSCGVCVYCFVRKRQGSGYGLVSDHDM